MFVLGRMTGHNPTTLSQPDGKGSQRRLRFGEMTVTGEIQSCGVRTGFILADLLV